MNDPRSVPIACACACMMLVVSSPASSESTKQRPPAGLSMTALPNQPELTCRSDNATTGSPRCADTPFDVVVNPLFTKSGAFAGCAAFFMYRALKVDTKKQTGTGTEATLKWQINPGPAAGAMAEFLAPGIAFEPKRGNNKPLPSAVFQAPVIDAAASQAVSVVVKKLNDSQGKSFDHLPVVRYKDNANPTWTPCGGVDPTISNNPS